MFLNYLNKYRAKISLFVLLQILFTGLPLQVSSGAIPYQKQPVREAALVNFSDTLISVSNINSGAKKLNFNYDQTGTSVYSEESIEIIKSLSYQICCNRESQINFRLYSFLTSHFSTST